MKVEKANWDKKTLGEVSVFKRGLTYPKIEECTYETSNIVLRSNNVDLITHSLILDELKYLSEEYKIPNDKKIAKNTILMCMSNGSATHIGKVAFIDKDYNYAFGGFMGLIMPKNINPKFLYYKYRSDSFKSFLGKIGNGINITNLKFSAISSLPILVPNPSIQQAIATELDSIQVMIDGYKAQLADLDALAQSIFLDMFEDPISNPKGWEKVVFASLTKSINYGTSLPAVDGGKYKYIRMGNITDNGYMNFEDLKYINIPDSDLAKYMVHKGDILFNRTNSRDKVGKTACFMEDEPMIIAGYIIRVRLNELKVLPSYIARTFNTPKMKDFLKNLARGSVGQANINSKELSNIPIPLPPLSLQQKFAKQVEVIEKQKDLLREQLKDAETLMAERMQYYFS